jgi:acetylornithine deacetylase
MVEQSFHQAVAEFTNQFSSLPLFARSAANARRITQLAWRKKGLPVLANRDAEMERMLTRAGIRRCPPEWVNDAFTSDAIWAQRSGCYSIVFGPGDLAANHAHADGEFVTIADLDSYAVGVVSLVRGFAGVQRPNGANSDLHMKGIS